MAVAYDLADVKALADLEKAARTLRALLEKAGPAYERLQAVEYPGVEHICCWGSTREELGLLIEELEDCRLAGENRGAADYLFFFKRCQAKSMEDAAKELLDSRDDISRVEPMRRYAESMA